MNVFIRLKESYIMSILTICLLLCASNNIFIDFIVVVFFFFFLFKSLQSTCIYHILKVPLYYYIIQPVNKTIDEFVRGVLFLENGSYNATSVSFRLLAKQWLYWFYNDLLLFYLTSNFRVVKILHL